MHAGPRQHHRLATTQPIRQAADGEPATRTRHHHQARLRGGLGLAIAVSRFQERDSPQTGEAESAAGQTKVDEEAGPGGTVAQHPQQSFSPMLAGDLLGRAWRMHRRQSRLLGAIPHKTPQHAGQQHGRQSEPLEGVVPRHLLHQPDQRCGGQGGANITDKHRETAQRGELTFWKPHRRKLHQRNERERDTQTNQHPAHRSPHHVRRPSEHQCADTRHRHAQRNDTARSQPVGQDPGRDLHHRVDPKITGRQSAQRRGACAPVPRQRVGHGSRRVAVKEREDEAGHQQAVAGPAQVQQSAFEFGHGTSRSVNIMFAGV